MNKELLNKVDEYLLKHYKEKKFNLFAAEKNSVMDAEVCFSMPSSLGTSAVKNDLVNELENMDESFTISLLKIIDSKGLKDSEVYKKANIDRKLFSKIRNEEYRPSKNTALALAIALELSLKDTKALINKLGYAISHSNKADVIVEYFIKEKIYDLATIDEVLMEYDQKPLSKY